MKSMIQILVVLAFALSAGTCKKDYVPPPLVHLDPFKDTFTPLPLVWKSYLDDNKGEMYSINPVLNSNGDVLVSQFSNRSNREPMMLFDGKTGVKKWQWDDYLRDEEAFFNRSHTVEKDILVLCAHNATYALNMLTGQTVWRHYFDTMYGSPFIFKDDQGYIYHTFMGEPGTYTSYIFRTPAHRLNWELVCSISDSANNRFSRRNQDNLVFTTNSKGEQLLLFQLWLANTIKDPNVLLACYNMSTRKYEWVKNYTDKYNEWGHTYMRTNGKMVFAYIDKNRTYYLVGINIADGSVQWEREIPSPGMSLLQYKQTLVSTLNGAYPVTCYDEQTGQTVWQQNFDAETMKDLNFTYGDANILKNYLFSTQCERLIVLNLDNGSIVFNRKITDQCLQYGVAINEQNRTFYVQDRTFVNCYHLPEEVKY